MAMRTSVQKWGNSLGIRIPKVVAAHAPPAVHTGPALHVPATQLPVLLQVSGWAPLQRSDPGLHATH